MTTRRQYRVARIARTVVSVVALVLLTAGITDYVCALTPAGRALASLQVLPAMMAGSVVWLAAWAVVTLVFGRVYCSTVCPVGTLIDIFARLRRLPTAPGRPARVYRYAPPRNRTRLAMLVITMVTIIVGVLTIASLLDPFSAWARICNAAGLPVSRDALDAVHRLSTVWLSLVVAVCTLVAIAATAVASGRMLCNTVCPVGTLLGLASNHALLRMEINTDLCTNCRRCEYACKARCINLDDHVVDASRCVMCLDCTDVCPDDAISYRHGRHTLSIPMMQTTAPSGRISNCTPTPPQQTNTKTPPHKP